MTELEKLLISQYQEEEILKILDGLKKERYTTFRINTLKTQEEVLEELKENNFILESVSWYPKANEDILDMTASPGSKTTQIATETNNKSRILAVEKNQIRYERLLYNLEKQGVSCCTVLKQDAKSLDNLFSFDKVLLDAPCSGSGTIKESELNSQRFNKQNILKFHNTQVALLKKALTVLKKNQQMIYSTCSILKNENEEVLEEVLKMHKFKIIPLEVMEDIPTLKTSIPGCICICPNEYYEGFFVALLEKL